MKRTLIVPATIALLTGMSATAQETNAPDVDVNASEAIIFSDERPELDELTIEELNALQLEALQKPAQSVDYAENTENDSTLYQPQEDDDTEMESETTVTAEADTDALNESGITSEETDMSAEAETDLYSEDTEMTAETEVQSSYEETEMASTEMDSETAKDNRMLFRPDDDTALSIESEETVTADTETQASEDNRLLFRPEGDLSNPDESDSSVMAETNTDAASNTPEMTSPEEMDTSAETETYSDESQMTAGTDTEAWSEDTETYASTETDTEASEDDRMLFRPEGDLSNTEESDTSLRAETDTEDYNPAMIPSEEADVTAGADADVSNSYSAETEEMHASNEDNDIHASDETEELDADTAIGGPDYSSETDAMTDIAMQGTIANLAAEDPRFTTLVTLVEKAGLTGTLNADGPYTVFAPTNAAFEKLDPELLAKLESGEDTEKLTKILKGHVVEGEIMNADIADGDTMVSTLADTDITVEKTGESVMADQATVIVADIDASNGVIHAVDSVLIPADKTPAVVEAEADVEIDTSIDTDMSDDTMEETDGTSDTY